MSGDVYHISDDQQIHVQNYPEGQFGDVKGRELTPAKMSRTVSALANADGGEIWVGIDEDRITKARAWRGFASVEDANAHVQILHGVFPFGTTYSFDFLEHLGSTGFVLHIEVAKSRNIVEATDGIPYLRRGAQNLPQSSDDQLRQLELNKGITSYETETVNADPTTVTNSETTIGFMLEVVPTAEPDDWLRKQQVLVGDLPTVAGVILFADEPQALLPKRCGVKVYRFTTTDTEGTRETMSEDPISIEGCAYRVIHDTVAKTTEIIGSIPKLGERGLEEVQYPPETLHEIITNAVLHRDYSLPDDIHVRIFDNRVEVESPGLLPGHITEANILQERFARNGAIVRLINKFPNPPNKDVGEGLNTAFAAMKAMRLRDPEVGQGDHSVTVYIRHTRLASPEDAVMEYLAANDEISNSKGRQLTGIRSDDTMKNVFGRLRTRGFIERVPNTRGRNSTWQQVLETDGGAERQIEEEASAPTSESR
mgnify:CR=1 FL=1